MPAVPDADHARRAAPPGHPWDLAAEGWTRHAAQVNAWLDAVTQDMLEASCIGPGLRVLDVAAGAGGQTHAIACHVGPEGHVLATDVSPRAIALARERARAAGLRQVETLCVDAEFLDLAGAGFDAAICRLGLMFCIEPRKALAAIAAALRPGGRFCAVVFSSAGSNPCIATMIAVAARHAGVAAAPAPAPGTIFSLGDAALLASLLRAAGFIGVRVRPVSAPFRMPSADHYIEFVRSSGSPIMELVGRLPPQAQAQAWAEMAHRLKGFDTGSGWEGPNELLFCEGRLRQP